MLQNLSLKRLVHPLSGQSHGGACLTPEVTGRLQVIINALVTVREEAHSVWLFVARLSRLGDVRATVLVYLVLEAF